MVETEKYDIIIVGGGISGLYTAWRLAKNTSYSIAVLEYSDRFGGRYRTCQMPGGFSADLGAMRFMSKLHPILNQLVEDMGLEPERFFSSEDNEITDAYFVRGEHIQNDRQAVAKLYGIKDIDYHYTEMGGSYNALKLPENGNFFTAKLAGTTQLARDVTLKQWWDQSLSLGVIELQGVKVFSRQSIIADAGIRQPFTKPDALHQLVCIKGGMECLISKLVSKLRQLKVKLFPAHAVTRVEELEKTGFKVKARVGNFSTPAWLSSDRLILACNARGLEGITWIGKLDRTTQMQKLLKQVQHINVTKLYLTYREAWWEGSGIKCGHVLTDLPITLVNVFGNRGKQNGYATLLVYSYRNADVLDRLNSEDEERFENQEGRVPAEQVPSKVAVQDTQRQLAAVFGVTDIPEPIAACITTWAKDPIGYAYGSLKTGVNHKSVYWRSLKPFDSGGEIYEEVYMIGDTFVAVDKNMIYTAWSEGALLTAERILYKYFGLKPYIDNLCLENPWPEDD